MKSLFSRKRSKSDIRQQSRPLTPPPPPPPPPVIETPLYARFASRGESLDIGFKSPDNSRRTSSSAVDVASNNWLSASTTSLGLGKSLSPISPTREGGSRRTASNYEPPTHSLARSLPPSAATSAEPRKSNKPPQPVAFSIEFSRPHPRASVQNPPTNLQTTASASPNKVVQHPHPRPLETPPISPDPRPNGYLPQVRSEVTAKVRNSSPRQRDLPQLPPLERSSLHVNIHPDQTNLNKSSPISTNPSPNSLQNSDGQHPTSRSNRTRDLPEIPPSHSSLNNIPTQPSPAPAPKTSSSKPPTIQPRGLANTSRTSAVLTRTSTPPTQPPVGTAPPPAWPTSRPPTFQTPTDMAARRASVGTAQPSSNGQSPVGFGSSTSRRLQKRPSDLALHQGYGKTEGPGQPFSPATPQSLASRDALTPIANGTPVSDRRPASPLGRLISSKINKATSSQASNRADTLPPLNTTKNHVESVTASLSASPNPYASIPAFRPDKSRGDLATPSRSRDPSTDTHETGRDSPSTLSNNANVQKSVFAALPGIRPLPNPPTTQASSSRRPPPTPEKENPPNRLSDFMQLELGDPFARSTTGTLPIPPSPSPSGSTHNRPASPAPPQSASSTTFDTSSLRAPTPRQHMFGSESSHSLDKSISHSTPDSPRSRTKSSRSSELYARSRLNSELSFPSISLPDPPPPTPEPVFYPIIEHLLHPDLLSALLLHLSFKEWVSLFALSSVSRTKLEETRTLREIPLGKWLTPVGYRKWDFEPLREPIVLTLRDLNSYMRGVSIASHQFAAIAEAHLASLQHTQPEHISGRFNLVRMMASSTRAFSRVVLRLRCQAEAEASRRRKVSSPEAPPSSFARNPNLASSRSRAPSPSPSLYSQSNDSGHFHDSTTQNTYKFTSPLFRLRQAAAVRVFVPSAEGSWMSDETIVECEKELKRAGVLNMMRAGDIVWNIAVGDEGNVGRLVWDGNYLIDLDYSYSTSGELPQYFNSLAFPPSYWHKIVRTLGNPVCYIDLAPYAKEIAANLQLLQDKVQMETPQGGQHSVIHWIHRSRFRIRGGASLPTPGPHGVYETVDPAWEGTVVVEAEGTNEGLADLQARCGPNVRLFPAKGAVVSQGPSGRTIFRLLRGKSRPGEIWIRTVREKERVL